ncbi:MAG: YihY/virulence factor BrkB family protein [Ornithinibacter sp.]
MAHEGAAATKERTAPAPDHESKPDSPADLTKPTWRFTAKSAYAEFSKDQCTDLAAALTYYSVLALFPALLALISLLGVFGQGQKTVDTMLEILGSLTGGNVSQQIAGPIEDMVGAGGAGLALVTGTLLALFSASGYVGAFGRAMNRIYQVDEGRPIWKLRPQMFLVTIGLVVMAALVLFGLVVSGPVAEAVGNLIGVGKQTADVWNIAKWPVILVIVMAMVAVLYYVTPNVKQPSFRWVSVGSVIAILMWVLASVGFGFYVGNVANYNKTYGTFGGIIVFLLWIWITNLALLFGAEVDCELERGRQLQAGIKAERSIQLPPRDASGSVKAQEKLQARIAQGRALRRHAVASGIAAETDDSSPAGRGKTVPDHVRDSTPAAHLAVDLEPLPSEATQAQAHH